ncbi:MAG: galactose oxidase [Thermoproteota archaeon]|nr:galactose oxidase [Thermoproteota archaeon]
MLSFCVSFTTSFAQQSDSSLWDFAADMPTHRTEISAEMLDGKIYVIGGADYQKEGVMDKVEIYDPVEDEWTEGAPLPIKIDHTSTVTFDGKIYLVGGFLDNKISTDKLLIYDPVEDEWTEGAPLPSPRGALTAEIINGTIYAVGGVNENHEPVSTNEAYDIGSNTWSSKAPLPKPRHHVASAVIDGKLYALGGRLFGNGEPSEINESLTNKDDNLRYDPSTNTWTELEPMPVRRSGFSATELNQQIFVFGGQGTQGSYDHVESYNPVTNTWRTEPSMPTERSGLAAVAFEDRIYVIGGQHEGLKALNVNEVFVPSAGR